MLTPVAGLMPRLCRLVAINNAVRTAISAEARAQS